MDALFDNQGKLPTTMRSSETSPESIRSISVDQVMPSVHQPRSHFDEEKISSLAESIKSQGIIQPIVVIKEDENKNIFKIIAGERRWRAAKLAGLKKVPVIVRSFDADEASVVALIENIQREDLNPLERARGLQKLCTLHKMKQQDLANKIGVSRTYLSNTLRLLKLSEKTQSALEKGLISEGHAKILCGINSAGQDKVLAKVLTKSLSVRDLEKLLKDDNDAPVETKGAKKQVSSDLKPVIDFFEEFFSMKVSIQDSGGKKGKVVFHYNSHEELDGMIDKLGVEVENRF